MATTLFIANFLTTPLPLTIAVLPGVLAFDPRWARACTALTLALDLCSILCDFASLLILPYAQSVDAAGRQGCCQIGDSR